MYLSPLTFYKSNIYKLILRYFSMFSSQTKRIQSLPKSDFNQLQKYLLSKSKHHQIYVTRHTYNPPIKHIDRSSDYLLRGRSKIKKVRHNQYKPEVTDASQAGYSLEKHSANSTDEKEFQKHNKLKSNKTLLSLLLNHFHPEHIRNEMLVDIDASFRQDKTSHTVSLHKQAKYDNHYKQIKEQRINGDREGLPKFESLHFNNAQKANNNKCIAKETKHSFYRCFPEVDANKVKEKSNQVIKNILQQSTINNSATLNPVRSQIFLHRRFHHGLKRKMKENKCQRSSQKCYKVCSKQKPNAIPNPLSKLDPWSTTMINEQIADL